MSRKAELFNKKASSPKSRPEEILQALSLKPGQSIADIGSGGGYFTLRFAEAVGGSGLVYAVDTNQEFLDYIAKNARNRGIANIKIVPASSIHSMIPGGSLNVIFLRNVYHHLKNRAEYFRRMSRLLKPEGRIAVIEYDGRGGFSFHKIFGHYVPQKKIAEEMREAGFKAEKTLDFLPEQSYTIFKKKLKEV